MVSTQGVVIFATILVAEIAVSHGFWYSFGSSSANSAKKLGGPPPPMPGYTLRSEGFNPWPNPPQYMADSGVQVSGMTQPMPVAVPYHHQGPPPTTLEGNLLNVRLVPCLCPTADMFSKNMEVMSQQQQSPQQPASYQPVQHKPASATNNP